MASARGAAENGPTESDSRSVARDDDLAEVHVAGAGRDLDDRPAALGAGAQKQARERVRRDDSDGCPQPHALSHATITAGGRGLATGARTP
jgi:hypothetical protein